MSCVTVMMWQPICVGLEDVQQLARARPDQLGVRARRAAVSTAAAISGTGSTPVSAMRPANTETHAGAPPATRVDDLAHLLERQQRRDVELHAGVRQPPDQRRTPTRRACWSPESSRRRSRPSSRSRAPGAPSPRTRRRTPRTRSAGRESPRRTSLREARGSRVMPALRISVGLVVNPLMYGLRYSSSMPGQVGAVGKDLHRQLIDRLHERLAP